ncbi:MAG: hypothetical protein CBD74_14295 [Saprospirales bacterium TMED214]|nr:MAG: hypothetical protein CBD74_14295 [Saprospirales bacterium TMED214]
MIEITNAAADHLKGIADANEGKLPFLGVKGGGCAGFSYDWQLKSKEELDSTADEVVQLYNGAEIAIDGYSVMYLFGSVLDLKKDLFGTTLDISTPAAQSSCGCGESINFDMEMVEANMNNFNIPDDNME